MGFFIGGVGWALDRCALRDDGDQPIRDAEGMFNSLDPEYYDILMK